MYGILNSSDQLIAKFTVPLSVTSNQPVFVSDALSLKRFSTKSSAQRWEIEAGLEPLSIDSEDLMLEIITKGPTETVNILMPQNYSVKQINKLNSTSINVNGTLGSTQITVNNFLGNIQKGSYFRFAANNLTKVYMTTSALDSTSLLSSTAVNIYPPLRANIVNQSILFRNDVKMPCLIDTDTVRGMVYNDGILMSVDKIKLIEKL